MRTPVTARLARVPRTALTAFVLSAGVAHADLGAAEPLLGRIPPGTTEHLAEARVPTASSIDEDFDALAADRAFMEGALARGGNPDNRATHYARGSTLVMHVFIDWYDSEYVNGTWDDAERAEAAGKAYLAKEYYLDHAPSGANLSFDNEGTTAYWYINGFYPGFIGTMNWEIMNTALQQNGVIDADADSLWADDYSIGLQNWNGGWDNVILVFQPADRSGRAFASTGASATALYTDDDWQTWAHEWGHLFGACDEYVEDGGCGYEDCGPCKSWYLDEQYYNGNCDLTCGAPGSPCLMKDTADADVICSYTRQQWSWEDEDGNGQLDWVKRISDFGAVHDIMEMWPNGYFYHYTQTDAFAAHVNTPGWTVFGLRSPPTADYDLRLFGDNTQNYLYASSQWSGQAVDFIVGDYHQNRLGVEHVKANRFSGSTDTYNIVWEGGGQSLYPDGVARAQTWIAENVVRAYDVPLFGGETITFEMDVTSGGIDLGMALFNSYGTTYFAGRSAAIWSRDSQGPAGTETFTWNVPTTDVYGLVVWTNHPAGGSFDIQIGPAPITLPEETPTSSTAALRLYNYDPTVPYWAVVASRPAQGGGISLRLCDDPEYTYTEALSNEPGDELELIAVDYSAAPINRDHVRVDNDNGTSFRTEWEQSADLSTGYISGSWTSSHVAKVWDVYLEEDQTYFFREYHPTNFLPKLNTGLYLFDPYRDSSLSKAQAADYSDAYSASEGERFAYTAGVTGFHGLTLLMNNEGSDTYSIWWGPRHTLQDDQAWTSSNEIVYGFSSVISNDWVVWGARPARGDLVDAWVFGSDGDYTSWEAPSTGAANVNILVSDRNHLPTVEGVYTRFRRTAGTGPVDYEYEGGVGENLPYTQDGAEFVTLTWQPGDVVEAFDLSLPGARANPAYVEIRAVPLTGELDLGMALFRSSAALGNYYQGLGDAAAVAADHGTGENEVLTFQTGIDDIFGLVVWDEDGLGGTYQLQILGSTLVATDEVPVEAMPLALRTGRNPVRGSALLSVSLPTADRVQIDIYDVGGRRLRTLVDATYTAGVHDIEWDGRDDAGSLAGAGVYLVRMDAGGETRTSKIVRSGS